MVFGGSGIPGALLVAGECIPAGSAARGDEREPCPREAFNVDGRGEGVRGDPRGKRVHWFGAGADPPRAFAGLGKALRVDTGRA